MKKKSWYPTLEKLRQEADRRLAIEDFLRWLGKEGIVLARWDKSGNHLEAITYPDEHLIFEYLGLDPAQVETERRQLLAEAEGV